MERTHFYLEKHPSSGFIFRNLRIASVFNEVYRTLFTEGMGDILEFGCGGNFHSYLAASSIGYKSYTMVDVYDVGASVKNIMEDISASGSRELVENITGFPVPETLPVQCVNADMAKMPIREESIDVAVALGLGVFDRLGKFNNTMRVNGKFDFDYVERYGDLAYSRAMETAAKAVKKGGFFVVCDYVKDDGYETQYIDDAKRSLEIEGFVEHSRTEPFNEFDDRDSKSVMLVMRKLA